MQRTKSPELIFWFNWIDTLSNYNIRILWMSPLYSSIHINALWTLSVTTLKILTKQHRCPEGIGQEQKSERATEGLCTDTPFWGLCPGEGGYICPGAEVGGPRNVVLVKMQRWRASSWGRRHEKADHATRRGKAREHSDQRTDSHGEVGKDRITPIPIQTPTARCWSARALRFPGRHPRPAPPRQPLRVPASPGSEFTIPVHPTRASSDNPATAQPTMAMSWPPRPRGVQTQPPHGLLPLHLQLQHCANTRGSGGSGWERTGRGGASAFSKTSPEIQTWFFSVRRGFTVVTLAQRWQSCPRMRVFLSSPVFVWKAVLSICQEAALQGRAPCPQKTSRDLDAP